MSKKRVVPPNRARLDGKSRIFGYEFGVLLCELLPRYHQYFQSDYAKVLIAHAVGVAAVSRLMARPEAAGYESLATLVPPELQVPVNALSIAESTGIPRETVRRKIKEMIAEGILMEDARGGYRMQPGALRNETAQEIYYQQLLSLVTLVNRCLDAGILRIEDA